LKGLDLSVDPCQDFYAFACNTFIKNNPPQTLSYGQTQKLINEAIAKKLNATSQTTTNGFPMLEKDWKEESLSNGKMWKAIATLELHYGLSTLLQSMVTVDYRNVSRNALYLDQLPLSMSRDYYVKPQFISELNLYRDNMIKAVKQFRTDIQSPASDETILSVIFYIYLFNYSFIGSQIFLSLSFEINELDSETTKAIQLEVSLAIATMPGEELRNYELTYNLYTLDALSEAFPNISWNDYLETLLEPNVQKNADPRKNEYILEMPTYFGTLNTYLEGKVYSKRTFVNLLMLRFIAVGSFLF
uniref:Peptidase_M13_N domain-containing protein n=1 Tax=Gongylonema pulchrum TaxID=637853 RepID=A0A183EPU6_9BILA